jgi:hypothetical protein
MQEKIQDNGSKNHDSILGIHCLKKVKKKKFLRVMFYCISLIVSINRRESGLILEIVAILASAAEYVGQVQGVVLF